MTFGPLSYWQSTSSIIPLSTDLPTTVDVAVIGGGIIGASACYWLARKGISVALLERNKLAHGATGRNGGFVVDGPAGYYQNAIARLGHEAAFAIMKLTRENRVLLRQILEEENISCDYREPGTIRLALTEQQLENLDEEIEALKTDGFLGMSISRENIQEHINTPITTGILGGQFIPEQGLVHSAKLVQGIVWAALRRGARAYHAEVFKLESSDNNITLHTSQGNMQAGKVIIATNAWTSKLLPELTNIILPIREQMLAYAPIAPIFTPSIAFDMVEGEYCQQTPDGAILIGGCTFATKTTKKESLGTWDCKPTAMVQNAIERVLPRLFPKLPRLYVTQRWAGLLDYTVDACPIVDQVPDMPGAFVAAGLSGHGMPFGMRFGQLLTKAVQDGTIAPELKPYRLDRPTLKEWRPSMLEELLDYTPNV